MLLGSVLAVQYGSAGWWYLLVGLARHIYVAAIWVRHRLGLPVIEKPNRLSRPLAGLQMGVSTALLAPALLPPYTILISTLVMTIFLGNFLMDWLSIGRRQAFVLQTSHYLFRFMPIVLRVVVFVLVAAQVIATTNNYFTLVITAFLLFGAGTRVVALVLLIQIGIVVQGDSLEVIQLITVICSLGLVYLGSGSFYLWAPENALLRRRLGEQHAK
jgi:hypothetical protein